MAGAAVILGSVCGLLYWRLRGSIRRLFRELRAPETPFQAIVESSPDVIVAVGTDSRVRYVSPAVCPMLGYRPEDLVGTEVSERLYRGEPWRAESLPVELRKAQGGADSVEFFRARHADGSWRYLEAAVAELPDGGRAYYLRDITERKTLEDDLAHRAFHDSLTGLANRALFMDRLQHALARLARHPGLVAVLFIDLDGFKDLNDSLGHPRGDEILATMGRRIRGCLRPSDTAARLGGDEFAVLLENIGSLESALQVGERILKALQAPIVLESRKLRVTASVGIAASGPGRYRAEDLLRAADVAVYRVKARGGSGYAAYEGGPHGRGADPGSEKMRAARRPTSA